MSTLTNVLLGCNLAVGLVILSRMEHNMSTESEQLAQLSTDVDQIVADEATVKATIAEAITELKAGQDGGDFDISSVIAKLESAHSALAADNSDLAGAETPAVPVTSDNPPQPTSSVSDEDPGTGSGVKASV